MARLFVFGIGGTGSRVIKALAMLLASGVQMNAEEVIPIIIDPDSTNGDMTRTIEILNNYRRVREKLSFDHNNFFKTKISTLKSLADQSGVNTGLAETFKYEIDGTKEGRFRDFIDYSILDDNNRALMDLLYSEENLDLKLDEGFKGNPNIGSVVLNQFKYSTELKQFASLYRADDRVFIVSSIFGGTGAAGFPLVLKNLRNADSTLSNYKFLQDAKIGAITVMPYFGVDPKSVDKIIDKGTFVSKTKAALSYYYGNIVGNNSVNVLYYIGDDIAQDYQYAEGKASQKNRAHLVELISAMSMVDFMNFPDSELEVKGGKATNAICREFGLKEGDNPINFTDLAEETRIQFFKPLIQFTYFTLYLRQQFNNSLNKQPWSDRGNVKIDDFFKTQPFFRDYLEGFTKRYWEWLEEMAANERAFAPFDLQITEESLYKLVYGVEQKGGIFGLNKSWNYGYFDNALNKAEREIGDTAAEQKLVSIFYKATDEIYNDKFVK